MGLEAARQGGREAARQGGREAARQGCCTGLFAFRAGKEPLEMNCHIQMSNISFRLTDRRDT